LSDAHALRILAVDNRSRDKARYDRAALVLLLQTIDQQIADEANPGWSGGLAGTGYSDEDLDTYLLEFSNEPIESEAEAAYGIPEDDDAFGAGPGAGLGAGLPGLPGGNGMPTGGAGGRPALGTTIGPAQGRGPTPQEYLQMYQHTALRQIMIVLTSDQYAAAIERLSGVMKREHLETNAEVLLFLLDQDHRLHLGVATATPEREPAAALAAAEG
jgi:hypothetical protein